MDYNLQSISACAETICQCETLLASYMNATTSKTEKFLTMKSYSAWACTNSCAWLATQLYSYNMHVYVNSYQTAVLYSYH